jgi:peroxiredoxin
MTTLVFGTILPWLLVAVGAWLGFQLVRQNGRILLRLESIERRVIARPPERRQEQKGLPTGSPAPDFELQDLSGERHTLSEFRGRDVLLVFFNPQCGFCTKMAPDLAALPLECSGGRALPIVISTGDPDENRKLVEVHGIRCLVLLQEQMDVASQFRAQGTPMGYRIDAEGRIASLLVAGAEPLLQLAERAPSQESLKRSGRGAQHKRMEPDPSLARSRINRSGLKSGTAAPAFTLPRIDGGDLSLADLRGGRVLLVFSDPECGPCDELAPRLQDLHVTRPDLQVLVISRRDADATRSKAESLGLTFPIVMQKQWELSIKYGMFATPIGYLIDEHGVLLSDVAVGVQPILQMANDVAAARTAIAEPSESNGQLLTAS